MNLSIRQLDTFREVIRCGSISQAARTLGRTQPAVSAMIAGLEQELGFPLFLRVRGTLTPTPEARYFLEECEDILARIDRTKQILTGISRLEAGKLRIACHPAASGFFLPQVLTAFLADKPAVEVSLMMRSSAVIEELVASQQFDVGFAETPRPRASLRQVDFALECVCAVPADSPFCGTGPITPADLDGADLATLFAEHTTYAQTRQAFADAGCSFNRRIELQTFLPGLRIVEAGLCCMICDMITAHGEIRSGQEDRRIVFRPFRPTVVAEISILTPAHRSQSILSTAFCAHLAQQVSRMRTEVLQGLAQ